MIAAMMCALILMASVANLKLTPLALLLKKKKKKSRSRQPLFIHINHVIEAAMALIPVAIVAITLSLTD